jgi:hypothetical protein
MVEQSLWNGQLDIALGAKVTYEVLAGSYPRQL